MIYWANAAYSIKIFGYEIFHFFPEWFYEKLGIPFRLAEGIQLHFFFMWFFVINGILYVAYTIFSGEWRALIPLPGSFKRALLVTLHDLHLRKEFAAARKIQRRAAHRLHGRDFDGNRFGRHGICDLQTDAIVLADKSARRLRLGALGTFLADDSVCFVFRRSHHSGNSRRLEQFSFDDYGLRSD